MRAALVVDRAGFASFVQALRSDDRQLLGPRVRHGAIVLDEVASVDDLPGGWTDRQEPGRYSLERRDDDALFGYAVGPQSWRRELLPPRHRLWSTKPTGNGTYEVEVAPAGEGPRTFLGVRACELAAMQVQDRVFLGEVADDHVYAANRGDVTLVAVDCSSPAATCFCPSMGTGPGAAGRGADVVVTEFLDGTGEYLLRAETEVGEALVSGIPGRSVTDDDLARVDAQVTATESAITRRVDADRVHDGLLGNLEHDRWDEVASRCLDCANCTLVCPTCFCTQVEDTTDLTGAAHHDRRWDSCFSLSHSHLPGGSVRTSTKARYRQWLTHKFATWIDQFGTSGCVGCGRCLTWCPVGIDITEEVEAIVGPRHEDPSHGEGS